MRPFIAAIMALSLFVVTTAPSYAASSDISAASKKVDCKDPKNKDNKACKK